MQQWGMRKMKLLFQTDFNSDINIAGIHMHLVEWYNHIVQIIAITHASPR